MKNVCNHHNELCINYITVTTHGYVLPLDDFDSLQFAMQLHQVLLSIVLLAPHQIMVTYRSGRGTMEQIFEKVITSCDYQACILTMDTSKAFDTMRSLITEDLKQILAIDELHLIEDVQLPVKINGETCTSFQTNIGTLQGD